MKPIFDKLSREKLPVQYIDIDEQRELAARFRVESLPTFVRVKQGGEVGRIEGKLSESQLRDFVAGRLEKPSGIQHPPSPTASPTDDFGQRGDLYGVYQMIPPQTNIRYPAGIYVYLDGRRYSNLANGEWSLCRYDTNRVGDLQSIRFFDHHGHVSTSGTYSIEGDEVQLTLATDDPKVPISSGIWHRTRRDIPAKTLQEIDKAWAADTPENHTKRNLRKLMFALRVYHDAQGPLSSRRPNRTGQENTLLPIAGE